MADADGNRLGDAVSPYLLQHRNNPVHWREWTGDALAEARARDRPILLSIGYAACHWCHVMAHESFEDAAVAAVMNRLFVNIKVDREERPDIDHLYMTALQAMGEQGGWPMTMFLTPDGRPFWGGTYFPKSAQHGRPGFVQVLEAISRAWEEKRADLDRSADAMAERLDEFLSRSAPEAGLDAVFLGPAAERVSGMIDRTRGGIGGAPKFPNAPLIELLARSAFPDGPAEHRGGFLLTLQALSSGGIYDHLGGGLHRYSVDERWLVPHFEKMLYDNAQFLRHLNWGVQATGEDLFRIRIEETIGWLEREMLVEGAGLAASLDADSPDEQGHSEEGAFYVWCRDEIAAALGPGADRFMGAYDVTGGGNWEGKTILHRLHAGAHGSVAEFAADRSKLLDRRAGRPRPGRDDKVLADWNGMAIRALAEIAQTSAHARALRLARNAFRFVLDHLVVDGRLRHAWRNGRTAGPALSSDYGALMSAAAALFAATLDPEYLRHGQWLAAELERWHGDGEGGHYLTAGDADDVIIRLRGDNDNATPSGTALAVEGLAMLAQASGDVALGERAKAAAARAAGRIKGGAAGFPGIVGAIDRLRRGSELAIVGEERDEVTRRMVELARRSLDLNRVDLFPAAPGDLPDALPLAGIRPSRLPAAFLCSDRVCRPPVYEPDGLARLLAGNAG